MRFASSSSSMQCWRYFLHNLPFKRTSKPTTSVGCISHSQLQLCFFQARSLCLQPAVHHSSFFEIAPGDGVVRSNGRRRFFSTLHGKVAPYATFEDQPPSWLFVSHAAAGAYGAQVNVDLDLDEGLSADSIASIQQNVTARGMEFDVAKLSSLYEQFKALERTRKSLEERKADILKLLKQLEDKDVKGSLAAELRQNKKEIKSLTKSLWDLEEQVMLLALQLPNNLHSNTPLTQIEVEREMNSQERCQPVELTHIEIANKYSLIKFSNVGPKAYYLKGQLASAEMRVMDVASRHLDQTGFRLMSGPEFFKTPILEGCGLDVYDTDKVSTIQHASKDIEPMFHLAGISPMTFAAYVARQSIGTHSLPLRLFSVGKTYGKGVLPGLFGATQKSQVGLFSCVSQDQVDEEFELVTETVWDFVKAFGLHVRLCRPTAKELRRDERRRTEVQIFAPSLNEFVPIARVSDLGDFVSRRLMTYHNANHGDIRHGRLVHMISGVALDVTTLLAVWMESSYSSSERDFTLRQLAPLLTAQEERKDAGLCSRVDS